MNSTLMVLCSILAVVVVAVSAASTKTENVPRSFSKPSSVETPTSSGTAGEAEGLERAEGRYYGGYGKKSAGNPFTIR